MNKVKKYCSRYLHNNKWQVLFFIISVALSFIWFRTGKQIAGGEESFSIFNNQDQIKQVSDWQTAGTGFPAPFYLNNIILVVFVKILSILNLSLALIQALFYFIVIFLGLNSFYYFQRELVDEGKNSIFFMVSCLFYLFNLYGMTQIWGRFLYAHMLLWAYLPLFLLLWIKWLKENRLKTLIVFMGTNLIFSATYSQPAFVLTLALPAALFGFLELWKKRHKIEDIFRLIFKIFIFFLSWLVSSIWWLYPNLILSSSSFSEKGDLKLNLDSLVSVSQYFRNWDILLLRQSFLLGKGSVFF